MLMWLVSESSSMDGHAAKAIQNRRSVQAGAGAASDSSAGAGVETLAAAAPWLFHPVQIQSSAKQANPTDQVTAWCLNVSVGSIRIG